MAPSDPSDPAGAGPPARRQVPLAGYTTLGLGGPAAALLEAAGDDALIAAVRDADSRREPLLIIGGGSNLVISDDGFPGLVVHVATRGFAIEPGPDGTASLTVAAGENWDDVVARCTEAGLAGLECLSGIPGLAGATPIQNVGAYGQEVADTITAVRVYDRDRRGVTDLPASACGFGYRTSDFKRRGRSVVLGVTFRLTRGPLSGPIRYPELARELGVAAGDRVPLGEARSAVLKLRARKGMVLDAGDPDSRSAGSFFTNPILTGAEFAGLTARARRIAGPDVPVPHFPAGPARPGQVKVPAAWLIERSGFGKGHPGPGDPARAARISAKHTLALVNPGRASTASLLALAREIQDGVRDTFGVTLVPEPVLVGVSA